MTIPREETSAEKRRGDARREIESAVFRLVGDEARAAGPADTTEGYETRGIYPGSPIERRFPLPEPALRAVMALRYAVQEQVRREVDNARGSGMGWAQITECLGLTKGAAEVGMSPDRAGWRFAAMAVFPGEPDRDSHYSRTYGPAAHWRCRTCYGSITEGDLEDGVQAQRGHTDTCPRFQGELAAERARWEDDWEYDD